MKSDRTIRIPSLRAVAGILSVLVTIGLVVFLRRYRGADRTAIAFGLTVGAGLCLMVAMLWFQHRFAGSTMTRRSLRRIGLKSGAVAGGATIGPLIGLLALRWGIDQTASPAGDHFLPAFLRAFSVLAVEMVWGIPQYLVIGAVLGALAGLFLAEVLAVLAPGPPTVSAVEER
jgi:hypothetical protein